MNRRRNSPAGPGILRRHLAAGWGLGNTPEGDTLEEQLQMFDASLPPGRGIPLAPLKSSAYAATLASKGRCAPPHCRGGLSEPPTAEKGRTHRHGKKNPLFPRYRADGLIPPYAGLTPPRFPQPRHCAERPFSTSHRRGSAGPFPDPAACSIPQGEAEAPANPIGAPSPNVEMRSLHRKKGEGPGSPRTCSRC